MNDFDLLDTECLLDVYHKQNLIRDEIMYALNIFPIFDVSCYDDVSDFLWLEYNIIVDLSLHVHCPECLSSHLSFYFERDFDFVVCIDILN